MQELIHWLELGEGARWIRRAVVLLGLLLLSVTAANKQFHGPAQETTLLQADMGRQLAAGQGFTTLVNFPQTAALMEARRRTEGPGAGLYPEVHYAPLYGMAIAGGLRVLPAAWREALFASPPAPTAQLGGFAADYFLLVLNVVLLWIAAWQTFLLGRKLFDERVGWVGMLALMLSVGVWQQVVLVDGLPLLMVLALAAFQLLAAIEEEAAERDRDAFPDHGACWRWPALGVVCALLFLAEYSAGLMAALVIGYAAVGFRGRSKWVALLLVAAGFLVPSTPWIVRNLRLTGSPVGLAWQNVALKAGDPTAEPAAQRTFFTTEQPRLDLNKLGNKGLSALQLNVKERLWSGGGYFLAAFFVAGLLYRFRRDSTNRMRWVFTAALVLLMACQPFLNSGESLRLPVYYLLPELLIFGAGFFFVLVESSPGLDAHAFLAAVVLLTVQAAPLAHDLMEPRRLHFHYPPYYPALFMRIHAEIAQRGGLQGMGVMADVPAGFAWYGRHRVWAQPERIRDFYSIAMEQPVGLLLLTPTTLDRPFFAQLAVNGMTPEGRFQKYQGWGPVYAGLVTGRMPAEFPLVRPQKLAENLVVLLDPSILPFR